ncbi:hypothetical protein BKP37_10645 [Anaerobacillus alkalilacustris]|uniref:SGNH hydrolase-type esterase domain-containing protein n=1 Tax=Anaerobacillus alkalilacustris TaxID=393763 RepID=A0A1S2LMT5_9BACI|nr:GDSL-type esterase/lipase family protein [Anaerobacillus alkalilacustris]OIJ13423.1 hypothetical protein BKP37_10645 [Anaerobacillus alkalilacustris]
MYLKPIVYTALGDSLTVGVGASIKSGFIKEYTYFSERALKRKIITNKYAKKGITSEQFIKLLACPQVRRAIYESDIITITIGGNDLIQANRHFMRTNDPSIFHRTLYSFKQNYEFILRTITELKSDVGSPYLIRTIGFYNPFPELPYSDLWIRSFNNAIEKLSLNYHSKFINIYPIFARLREQALTFDRLHPNHYGYQLIAYELYYSGYNELNFNNKGFLFE